MRAVFHGDERSRAVAGLILLTLVLTSPTRAAEPRLRVVASFSILGDFVRNVGGERVELATLVGPNGDAHVYAPAPSDAKTVAAADLLVINGLGFEGWLPRLVASTGKHAAIVEASHGVAPRHASEAGADQIDPHAWQSVANAKIYVANIRDALASADPAGAASYAANAAAYLQKLDALDAEIHAAVAKIPPARRQVVSTHDAFGYFADAYGISFVAPQGVSTDTEPTARDIAAIILLVRVTHIPAVFLEKLGDPRLIRRISAETGAKVGGTLYSDSLSEADGDAPTYIDLMKHNIRELTRALAD
jgi:zinc/manganese transport system substrate-binding protein